MTEWNGWAILSFDPGDRAGIYWEKTVKKAGTEYPDSGLTQPAAWRTQESGIIRTTQNPKTDDKRMF